MNKFNKSQRCGRQGTSFEDAATADSLILADGQSISQCKANKIALQGFFA